ncbi:AAA family ATPase [Aeromonas tecta]|uniref:AAA family ATPase n=1 Tax=Aeromonas tecta TaxID=324617 RepID=UPI000A72D6CB|nr:AAA family ATPase [Aeromonas tecta]
MKIKKVEIEGFRAYKFKKDGVFDFTLGDGTPSNFIALYAPNGFGKSSFYDAVEWAFTSNLGRYTAEHNKKINNRAARGTKQDQIPLKILRNKDVPDNIVTRVDVITTCGDFPRSLPKLRSNTPMDLNLGPTKTKTEGKGFEKIILSQDAIDRFLKEAKPQERYQLFMQYFGGEDEMLRMELTAILTENKITLDSLKQQKTDIKRLLKAPVDTMIFEKFNSLAKSLNHDGENISYVTEAFDSNMEYSLLSSLTERKHSLSSSDEATRKEEAALSELTFRLEEFQLQLDVVAEQTPKFILLTKGVADSQRYQAMSSTYNKYLEEWQKQNEQLTELSTIEGLAPIFLIEESKLKSASDERNTLINEQSNISLSLSAAHASVKQCQDALSATERHASALRAVLTDSPAAYSELSIHQHELQTLKTRYQEKFNSITMDKAQQENIKLNLGKLSVLPVNMEILKGPDSTLFELPITRLQEVYFAHQELELLLQNDSAIRNTQLALTQQKQVIERLVSQGLTYLADWPSNTCPLCRANHPSSDTLISSIRNNDLLTEAAKQNARQLEKIAARISQLKSIIDSTLNEAQERLHKRIIDLQTQLNQLSSRIESNQQILHSLTTTITITEQTIATLQVKVWNLNSSELHSRVNTELAALSSTSSSQQELLNLSNKHLTDLQAQMEIITSRLEVLLLSIDGITTKESYTSVLAFAKKEVIRNVDNLLEYCAQKRLNLESSIQESYAQMVTLSARCNELQQTMLDDGNWIDFQLLVSQKESISKNINDATFFVDSFLGSLSRLLEEDIKPDVVLIKQKIELAIQTLSKKSADITMKINQIDLLIVQLETFKPYLESLELRKRLSDIDKKISEHQLVNTKLSADRELVFKELRERIGAFFFSNLINAIYSKIDPHPSFKEVDFIPDFDSAQPGLNIVIKDESGGLISPILYFSSAQLNILSLSVFLANALHAKDDKGNNLDVILIDDPIQSMDSINVLAVIDLLRNISLRFDKQIIISTHDENFFNLLKLKIPTEVFGSKFLQLETFGVVSQVQNERDFAPRLPTTGVTSDNSNNK